MSEQGSSNNRGPSGGSRGGRARGVPNKDKTELRALTQEAVHHFTDLRRKEITERWAQGWRISPLGWVLPEEGDRVVGELIPPHILDSAQPLIEEYDPVVELSIMAADYRNEVSLRRQANADAAQYLRPKLKSIELLEDPESLELQQQKNDLAGRMVDILDAMAQAKRQRGAE